MAAELARKKGDNGLESTFTLSAAGYDVVSFEVEIKVGSLPLESWCLLSYAGEVRRGLCPLRRSLFSFYLLLLGPAGQVQAEKEQVRGKIKRFLGGASPIGNGSELFPWMMCESYLKGPLSGRSIA